MSHNFARLARMDWAEIRYRSGAFAHQSADRARLAVAAPTWNRRDLLSRLDGGAKLKTVRAALEASRWHDAHRGLSNHFASEPQRFVISRPILATVADRIRAEFPESAEDAAARADRVLSGQYDLLGYRGLGFDRGSADATHIKSRTRQPSGGSQPSALTARTTPNHVPAPAAGGIDWHYDPVHDCRAPQRFWADVPYLDPACGDHKIIWELNRHQHWLALGRAFCLTGASKSRDRWLTELASWLEANPPLMGVNWASMLELGFRCLSWMWALHFFVDPSADEAPWTVDLLLALDRQLTHIQRNLSYYFSPNTHLLGEGLALYVAGRTLPELSDSPRREALGRRLLVDGAAQQILADGGHCERSTHYHRYALDFYLLASVVARITGDPVADGFERTVARLARAARILADGRGRLPHIGDDDGGVLMPMLARDPDDIRDSLAAASLLVGHRDLSIEPAPEEVFWLLAHPSLARQLDRSGNTAAATPLRSAALPDTGYYVSRSAHGDHLVIDGGLHGYQNCGHAHADALSLTFTFRGVPLLIDPGTCCYTIDRQLRDRFRSSGLHNTLVIDGRSQSVPHGPFHWRSRADSHVRRWRTYDSFDYFEGAHDGYCPLEHRRHVFLLHGDLLVVADFVDGAGQHVAMAHWQIDPQWTVHLRPRRASLVSGGARVDFAVPHGLAEQFRADCDTGLGWQAPVYGQLEAATTIRVSHQGDAPFWLVSVFGLDAHNSIGDVETVPVWAEAGVVARATALQISRRASVDYVLIAEPNAPDTKAAWRVGDFETDGRMLFARVAADGDVVRTALVDGSWVRAPGRRSIELALPHITADAHVEGRHQAGACSGRSKL